MSLKSLMVAVDKFLGDIYWDELGSGTAVAIFDTDQINDLRDALEAAVEANGGRRCKPWCGQRCPEIGNSYCFHTEENPNRWCSKKCRDAAERRGEIPSPEERRLT